MADFGFNTYDVVQGDTTLFVEGMVAAYQQNEQELRNLGWVPRTDAMHQLVAGEVDFGALDPTRD